MWRARTDAVTIQSSTNCVCQNLSGNFHLSRIAYVERYTPQTLFHLSRIACMERYRQSLICDYGLTNRENPAEQRLGRMHRRHPSRKFATKSLYIQLGFDSANSRRLSDQRRRLPQNTKHACVCKNMPPEKNNPDTFSEPCLTQEARRSKARLRTSCLAARVHAACDRTPQQNEHCLQCA